MPKMRFARSLSERIYKATHERNAIQRYVCRKVFPLCEAFGFHVLGDHFYEPVPNLRMVRKKYVDEPRSHLNIEFDVEKAEEELLAMLATYGDHFLPDAHELGYEDDNDYFCGLDAVTLYCFIRARRCKRVIEVGQGMSTRVIIAALARNGQESAAPSQRPRFTSIDPYARLNHVHRLDSVEIDFVPTPLEYLEQPLFDELGDGDLLFIDSSHVYKFGSDVEYLFENVYPRLARGVYVHLHDIFSPYHYPIEWLIKERRFWNEQYYLETLLRYGKCYDVVLPLYYLARQSKGVRTACGPHWDRGGARSSFYIRKAH